MSGYLSGILAILCINLIFAYGIFVPAAAGQINLGGAGFQAIGAYSAGVAVERGRTCRCGSRIPAAMLIAGLVGFLISLPGAAHARRLYGAGDFRLRRSRRRLSAADRHFSAAPSAWSCQRISICRCWSCARAVGAPDHVLSDGDAASASPCASINDDEAAAIVMGVNVRAVQVTAFDHRRGVGGAFGRALCPQFQFR